MSTYILLSNFLKINQDISVTYWTLTGFPYIPFVNWKKYKNIKFCKKIIYKIISLLKLNKNL